MRLEGMNAFLGKRVIEPFEDSVRQSYLEKKLSPFSNEGFKIESSPKPLSTSWKEVYEGILSFLEIRAEDSRAFSQDEVEYIQGIGYTIKLDSLIERINKLKEEAASKPSLTTKISWPKKEKGEFARKISLPDRDYSRINVENYHSVLQAKRFCTDAKKEVIDPFKQELIRWFEINTGHQRPNNIPDNKTRHVERTIEIASGSYIQVQLVREENPRYIEVISDIISELEKIKEGNTSSLRHSEIKGHQFVNIGSIKEYLSRENLEKRDLIAVDSRYCIVP